MKREINNRNSSVEAYKLFVLFLIVISHVTQTLMGQSYEECAFDDYIIGGIGYATTNFSILVLNAFRYFGMFGNSAFFVASAWYLVEDDTTKTSKIINMILDCWVVSIIILIIVKFVGGVFR